MNERVNFRVSHQPPTRTLARNTLAFHADDPAVGPVRTDARLQLTQIGHRRFELREDEAGLLVNARGYVRFWADDNAEHPHHRPVRPTRIWSVGAGRWHFELPEELEPPHQHPNRGKRLPDLTVAHTTQRGRESTVSQVRLYVRNPGTFLQHGSRYELEIDENNELRLFPAPEPTGRPWACLKTSNTLSFWMPVWDCPFFRAVAPATVQEAEEGALRIVLPKHLPAPGARSPAANGRAAAPAPEAQPELPLVERPDERKFFETARPAELRAGEVLIALADGSTLHYKGVSLADVVRISTMLEGRDA